MNDTVDNINDNIKQVYLVMGGFGSKFLSSTEQYTPGDTSWTESTALPRPLWGLKATSLDNKIFITGEMMIIIMC